ncbi:MAG TPA: NAD(P)-dependent oxidoreductase [Candidatus Acidoferrales bacterium]|nr:NAD(P)-dependent oxidoreductase [Candidatus Acidoferrales bacterium]
MNVGFIGLGNMGHPIAENLLKAGHTLVVYNRTRARAESLASQGARVAATPAEACRGDVVFTMLADDAAVEAMVLGDGGVISSLAAGAVHVSLSTISVALSTRLAEAHARAGSVYVAAPVFGRPEAAAAAKLFVVAAGPAAALARCQPLFDAIGQRTFIVGERASAANVIKLAGNFLLAAVVESLGEAFALVRKNGIDPAQFLDLITSSLFTAPVYKTYGSIIAREGYQPAGFQLPLGLKDVRLALAAAESVQVPLPLASLVRDHMISALARGYGNSDWSVIAKISAENAGL